MADPIDVFISYKREERALAERVMAALQQAGYVAVADLNIGKSDDFAQSIDRMIRAARLTLVLWTRASAGSEWVQREAQLALALHREGKHNQYLGVMVEPLGAALRVDFHGLQMVDVAASGLDAGGIETVVAEVRAILGRPVSISVAMAETRSAEAMDELRLFQMVRAMDTASGYEHFLSAYPDGKFAKDARSDLARARAWYMHPFRRGSIGHTVGFAGVLVAIGFGLWGAAQREPGTGVADAVHQRVVEERDAAQAAEANAKAEAARLARQVGDLTTQRDLVARELEVAKTVGTAATVDVARLKGQLETLSKDHEAVAKRLADAERSVAAEAEAARVAKALAESRGLDLSRARERIAALEGATKQLAVRPDCTVDRKRGILVLDKCYAVDSESLRFSKTGLVDLSKVSGFFRLVLLNLSDTWVADLSPLRGLPTLQWLDLGRTPTRDLSPLASLDRLTMLVTPDGRVHRGRPAVTAAISAWSR